MASIFARFRFWRLILQFGMGVFIAAARLPARESSATFFDGDFPEAVHPELRLKREPGFGA